MPVSATPTRRSLIAGYESYVDSDELLTIGEHAAPAVSPTPAILSFIGGSSIACGTGASVITGSATGTLVSGC